MVRVPLHTSLVGRLLRRPLRALPQGTALPVLTGPLRGARWMLEAGVLSAWAGTYERPKQRAFAEHVSRGQTVFDIGAHAGFYALLASRLVGPSGRVVAVEPSPPNVERLRDHVALNGATNIEVMAAAVSDMTGTQRFDLGPNAYEGRLTERGGVQVPCVTLDEMCERHGVPNVLKIDVEGAEVGVLAGGATLFARKRPTVLLATHSVELRAECRRVLVAHGYRVTTIGHDENELLAT